MCVYVCYCVNLSDWLLLVCTYVVSCFFLFFFIFDDEMWIYKKIGFKIFTQIWRSSNLLICTANWYRIYYYAQITMEECLVILLIAYFLRYNLIIMKYDHVSVHFTDIKWTCDVINRMYIW